MAPRIDHAEKTASAATAAGLSIDRSDGTWSGSELRDSNLKWDELDVTANRCYLNYCR